MADQEGEASERAINDPATVVKRVRDRIQNKERQKKQQRDERKRKPDYTPNLEDRNETLMSAANATKGEIVPYFKDLLGEDAKVVIQTKIDGFSIRVEYKDDDLAMILKGGSTILVEPELRKKLLQELKAVHDWKDGNMNILFCELTCGDDNDQGKAYQSLQHYNYKLTQQKYIFTSDVWMQAKLKLYVYEILRMTPEQSVEVFTKWKIRTGIMTKSVAGATILIRLFAQSRPQKSFNSLLMKLLSSISAKTRSWKSLSRGKRAS